MVRGPGGSIAVALRAGALALVLLLSLLVSRDARAQTQEAPLADLQGHWVLAPAPLTPEAARATATDTLATLASLDRTGGPYWYVARLTVAQAGRYVLDFKNSSTIGQFRHLVLDDAGRVVSDQQGGIESSAPNPFFLRHGRELDLDAGTYRLVTEMSSPFLLAEPEPIVAPLESYRRDIEPGDALVLLGLGVFLGLGIYYAALAVVRRRAADGLYAAFVLGNILYNASALLVLPQLAGMHWFYLVSAPILLSNTAYVLFVTKLLDVTPASNPRLARLGSGLVALLLSFVLVALVRPRWSLELDRAGVAVFAGYGLVSAVVRSRQGSSVARFYLVAVGALFILALSAITLQKVDSRFFYVEHLGLVAVVTESILLALVLAHQIATVDLERNRALDRAERHARIALTDALTGLANRYALDRDLERLPPDGCLTFIDLDGLKRYNDEFGHARGDELLCGFARHLGASLDGRATAYRLAGDEFAVMCPGGDEDGVAEGIARAVRALDADGFRFAGASYGSARRRETHTLEELKRTADRRMYEHKTARKSAAQTAQAAQRRAG